MEIRSDFASAKTYLERLLLYGKVFHENNVQNWPHLKNQEDFKFVYDMDHKVRRVFESIYGTGRDLASYMSSELGSFNNPAEHPTLTSYVKSLEGDWLGDIEQLKELSRQAKEQKSSLKESCPWAVEQMIILFDKQIELLQHIADTLNFIKMTDIYRIEESAGPTMEKPTSKMRQLQVFLCHSSGDKPKVRALYHQLRKDGVNAWLDEENLLPGHDWQAEIPKAVRNSDVVIVCLSKGSVSKTGFLQKEIKLALDAADERPEGTIFIIPLKLEECDVPDRLSRWQWVNLFDDNGYERLMRSLNISAESKNKT